MSIAATTPFGAPLTPALGGSEGKHYPPVAGSVSTAKPHRLTVEQVEAMIRGGILTENDRCELIRGELIDKMSLGDFHMAVVKRLNRQFNRLAADQCLVGVQDAIKLRDSLPEPDLVLLNHRDDFYASGTPTPVDIQLVVEVSDSTLEFDRRVKLPLYAENGVREYWIVNLIDHWVEVYRQPQARGTYAQWRVVRAGESLSPMSLPEGALFAGEILGSRSDPSSPSSAR